MWIHRLPLMQKVRSLFKQVLFATALLAGSAVQGANAQPTAARESNIVVISPRHLTTNQADAFEEFKNNGRYFGAFYVSSSGAFSWRSNLNTLDAAKLLSFQSCNLSNKNCQTYATLTPKLALLAKPLEGLSMTAAESAERWLRESTTGGRSAAVAANRYFGWAGWQGKLGTKKLRRSAINHCKDKQRSRLEKLEKYQRDALEREGLLKCSIVLIRNAR